MFMREFAGTYSVRKSNSTCWFTSSELTELPTPFIFVVNLPWLALPLVHVSDLGEVVGVEKITVNFDRSTDDAPGPRPTENLISLIPFVVSFDNPYTFPINWMFEVDCSRPLYMVSWAFWVVKNPAPSTTYENTAATTTNAMRTIAASRPVNPSSLCFMHSPSSYPDSGKPVSVFYYMIFYRINISRFKPVFPVF